MISHSSAMELFDHFDCAFVINLPERADRLRAVERELAKVGVPFASGRVELFRAIRPREAAGFPSAGYRGCFLSHYGVVRAALERGSKSVLILEDDIAFRPALWQRGAEFLARLKVAPWDVVYLGHGLDTQQLPDGLCPFRGEVPLLHFYGLKNTIYQRLLSYLDDILTRCPGDPRGCPMSPDGALSLFRRWNPDVRTLVANPPLAFQRSSPSDLGGHPWFDSVPALRSIAVWARAARTALRRRRC